jgi:CRISPR-associated exonuclease Cas4
MVTNPLYLLISAALVLLALVFFIISRWLAKRTGIPDGRIIYSDLGVWQKNRKPLYDAEIGLTGKPDYLIKLDGRIIPAEVKSSYAPRSPYDSHILQLAAYCVLVESTYGKHPPYGLLRYRNRTFKIEFTQDLEEEVLEMIGRIRRYKNKADIPRSHNHKGRCARCGYRSVCDQRL